MVEKKRIDVPEIRGPARIILDDSFLGIQSGIKVTVKYPDGSDESLTTDDDGIIIVNTDRGVYIDLEFETELKMHQMRIFVVLDDISTPSGAWQRLVNMGYVDDPEPPSEPFNEDTLAAAIEEFQSEHDINPSGEMDNNTLSKLREIYASTTPWNELETSIIDDKLDSEYESKSKDGVA